MKWTSWIVIALLSAKMAFQVRGRLSVLEMKFLLINDTNNSLVHFQLIFDAITGLSMNWSLQEVLIGCTPSRIKVFHWICAILPNLLDKYVAKSQNFANIPKILRQTTWSMSLILKMDLLAIIISCFVTKNVRPLKSGISVI